MARVSDIELALLPAERITLEVGSAIVLSALALGIQLGGWPLWSAALGAAGYIGWTVLYSEATVQVRRWGYMIEGTSVSPLAAQAMAPPG